MRLRLEVDSLSESPSLFPLFLKLEGKKCLVVGAGAVGLEKVESLLRCGASIRVIAPEAVERLQQMNSRGEIEWLARCYEPEDQDGCDLVIAATSDRVVNRGVFEEASRRSILCNTADDAPLCDFFFASIVQRGQLQIAISTAGRVQHWRSGCGVRSTLNCHRTWGPGLGSSEICGVKCCKRYLPGQSARRSCTILRSAKFAPRQLARPEPLRRPQQRDLSAR